MRNIFNFKASSLAGGAFIVALTTIVSKLLGLARDKLLANFFGPGVVLDSYFAAFRIPDFIFNSLVLGVLGAALIPVLTSLKDKEKYDNVVANVTFVISVSLLFLSFIAWLFAPELVRNITSGFTADRMTLTISMTRIMLLSVIIFGVSNVIGSVLQAKKIFTSVSVASIVYNLGIIAGTFVAFKYNPLFLAWGVVFGAFLHLLTQIPGFTSLNISWKAFFKFSYESISVFKLMLPRIVGLISGQLGLTIVTAVISLLPVGSMTVYSLATNIQSVPYSVIGVAIAVAAFPFVSEAASASKQFAQNQLNSLIRLQLLLLLPVVATMWFWRYEIVFLLIGGGNFKINATKLTAQLLAVLLFAVIPMSLQQLSARTMYALKNTLTPTIISIGSLILISLLTWYFKDYGIIAVCVTLTVVNWLSAIIMYFYANKGSVTNFYKNWLNRIIVALIISILPHMLFDRWFNNLERSHLENILIILISSIISLLFYGLSLWGLQVDEFVKIFSKYKEIFKEKSKA